MLSVGRKHPESSGAAKVSMSILVSKILNLWPDARSLKRIYFQITHTLLGQGLFFGCNTCICWLALLADGHSLSGSESILSGYFSNESFERSWDMAWALGVTQLSAQSAVGERIWENADNRST